MQTSGDDMDDIRRRLKQIESELAGLVKKHDSTQDALSPLAEEVGKMRTSVVAIEMSFDKKSVAFQNVQQAYEVFKKDFLMPQKLLSALYELMKEYKGIMFFVFTTTSALVTAIIVLGGHYFTKFETRTEQMQNKLQDKQDMFEQTRRKEQEAMAARLQDKQDMFEQARRKEQDLIAAKEDRDFRTLINKMHVEIQNHATKEEQSRSEFKTDLFKLIDDRIPPKRSFDGGNEHTLLSPKANSN